MKYTVSEDFKFSDPKLNALDFEGQKVIVMTCHRRENYGEPMAAIMRAVRRLAENNPDVQIV